MTLPHTKEAVKDTVVAAAFMTMGALLPGSLLDKGFEAHVGGIVLGIGIGWLIKSIIDHNKGTEREA